MKFLRIFLIMALCMVIPSSCIGQAKLFKEAAAIDGVTSIFVGKTMLRTGMAGLARSGDKDITNVLKYMKKLNSIELVVCEDKAKSKRFNSLVNRVIAEQNMEPILEVNESGKDASEITMYSRANDNPDSNLMDGLVITVNDGEDNVVIHLSGLIDVEGLVASYTGNDGSKDKADAADKK